MSDTAGKKPRRPRKRKSSTASPQPLAPSPQPLATNLAPSLFLSDFDIHLFREGTHYHLFDKLGSHLVTEDGASGARFGVWAPNAEQVTLVGDFNNWDPAANPLSVRWDGSGIWEGFIPGILSDTRYKYHVVSHVNGYTADKADPLAPLCETPPGTASRVWDPAFEWHDLDWMAGRSRANAHDAPISVYEVHLGSWRRKPEDNNRSLTYREIAPLLADYVRKMGFTHVELMPVMEHPFYGSWGYQITGFFAPSSRYGTPQDLMFLIDYLHQQGIGVILDWVPSHFPSDVHGLAFFDGTHLYEHEDPRQGFHPEWTSHIFNYGRNEVRSFLISSAMLWLERYHADGLRVDGVASMLYLDYARKEGEWIPNAFGGRENLEAIAFLKQLNEAVYREHPDIQMIAEESSAWPMVSRPTYVGGLGFGLKWDMGWMHDTLSYISKDPIHRKFNHNQLTFSMWYAFQENFMLPLSHDEVVYGKGSLLRKMPGDDWQKFANLRLLLGYLFTHPGKKLLFMGGEFGQWDEWDHERSLDWHLLEQPPHQGIRQWMENLNQLYRRAPELHELDHDPEGFRWIDCNDAESSVVSYIRKGRSTRDVLLTVANFTPVSRKAYRVGVPAPGYWQEVLNSDAEVYGGSGQGNAGGKEAEPVEAHGLPNSLTLLLPPLSILIFKHQADAPWPAGPGSVG